MTNEQCITAAEIVYALTNDKGRTRKERAGEHYYAGIRETPYAPFVKRSIIRQLHGYTVQAALTVHCLESVREPETHRLKL